MAGENSRVGSALADAGFVPREDVRQGGPYGKSERISGFYAQSKSRSTGYSRTSREVIRKEILSENEKSFQQAWQDGMRLL